MFLLKLLNSSFLSPIFIMGKSIFFYTNSYILLVIIMIKNYLNSILYFILIILVGTVFITLFHYFSIFSIGVINGLKMFITIISGFISSFLLGKNCSKKGYLEGLKLGGIIVFILIILNLIFNSLSYKSIIFFMIILITSMLGSMIGINKHKRN